MNQAAAPTDDGHELIRAGRLAAGGAVILAVMLNALMVGIYATGDFVHYDLNYLHPIIGGPIVYTTTSEIV
jgi:hypothetical protein